MPNAAFVDDPAEVSDKRLDSPSISIATATAQLTFRQNRNLESGFDGGVLEISIDGGAFQDILTAGGGFAAGGYDGTISSSFSNPLAGRQAWTGNSSGFVTTTVNLPAAAAGHNVVLRFRMGSDTDVSNQGWRIDSLLFADPGPPPPPPPPPPPASTAGATAAGHDLRPVRQPREYLLELSELRGREQRVRRRARR